MSYQSLSCLGNSACCKQSDVSFINFFTKACHWLLTRATGIFQNSCPHSKIHFNIFFQSIATHSKLCPPLKVFGSKIKRVSLFPHAPHIDSHQHVACLTKGPQPLPKRFSQRMRAFNFHNFLFSIRSSSNCLRLLPHLLVTSIHPYIFPSVTCFRRQFLRKP